jgi:DNA modification methylase
MSDPLIVIHGDALSSLKQLESESVQTCVTSPPYFGLRDYGIADQLGLERTPEEYVSRLLEIFREVRRVLTTDGVVWLNLGDSYAGSAQGWCKDKQAAGAKQKTNSGSLTYSPDNIYGKPPNYISSRQPNGLKPKDLIGIPWMVAFALRADGWFLRSDIIWAKANCMPESVTDRPTRSHEYIFLLSKSQTYYYNHEAIKEVCIYDLDGTGTEARKARQKPDAKSLPTAERHGIRQLKPDKQRGHSRRHDGFNDRWDRMEKAEQCTGLRNKRDVWTIAPANFPDAHFATFPEKLVEPCILAGAPIGGVVLDPFAGSGTTGKVAIELGRKAILIEPKLEYISMIQRRCKTTIGLPLAI